jgi:transketolase
MAVEPVEDKWRAFNWDVRTVDGHDVGQVREALLGIPDGNGRPRVVLASTIKGRGISFMENKHQWHYGVLDAEKTQAALEEIG